MIKDYKGYSAKVTVDQDEGLLCGEVVGIVDVVTFQGKTVEELTQAFHDSVDDYLDYCRELGKKPDKPYSGRFVLRVAPELHRRIALAASKSGVSMNEWITAVLEAASKREAGVPHVGSATAREATAGNR